MMDLSFVLMLALLCVEVFGCCEYCEVCVVFGVCVNVEFVFVVGYGVEYSVDSVADVGVCCGVYVYDGFEFRVDVVVIVLVLFVLVDGCGGVCYMLC